MGIRPLSDGAPRGYQVSLSAAVVWAARETRLHNPDQQTLEVNLKLDGRPFFGRCNIFLLYPGLLKDQLNIKVIICHFVLNKIMVILSLKELCETNSNLPVCLRTSVHINIVVDILQATLKNVFLNRAELILLSCTKGVSQCSTLTPV